MQTRGSGKPLKGSKSPGIGYLYITLIMFMAVAAGTLLSGGFIPVDPNGPGGPPTLPPYFGQDGDADPQQLILPTGLLTPNPKDNLQLKTFTVNTCNQTSAIDILIDTSGSMTDDNKIGKLKEALRGFTSHLKGSSAIAMQTFSADAKDVVKWDLYKNNKQQVQAAINGLNADGWTSMRDGFQLAKERLFEAKSKNKFPGYNYYLLVISDGVPEIPPDRPRTCYVQVPDPLEAPALRCFAKEQDPTVPTNLPSDIKNYKIPIYAIGLYSNNSSDLQLEPYLIHLLRDQIASQPSSNFYFEYNSGNTSENLKKIFNSIVTNICSNPLGT
jgi:hypothetical protein